MIKRLSCCLFLVLVFSVSLCAREVISLNKDWTFQKGFIKLSVVAGKTMGDDGPTGEKVDLPHTWNAADFQTEGSYYRGYGNYTRTLEVPEEWYSKRLFIKFEGAGSMATLLVNGVFVGEHKGAYNAFTFEITDYVEPGENTLAVVCSNAPSFEIAPYGGDFNIYGGLYRDVWLEVTEPECISPLYLGSDGVLISQDTNREHAELSAEIHLSTLTDYDGCEVRFSLENAAGEVVACTRFDRIFSDVVNCRLGVDAPHLWNGKADPYLYKAVVTLERDGKELDRVEDPVGLRYFHVDPEKGFFLNGEHLKLKGVSRHQDWDAVGSALTVENHLADYAFFDEMGVNSLRLAHYPQAPFMFDFGASGRMEGDSPNQNDKGLVTIDRKVRKDAFYYYKANWNKEEPLVHLCSKGYSEREEPVADIVVFTTAPSATLNLNGKKLSTKKTDTYATVEWKGVELQEGANSVRIVTAVGEDTAVWNVRMR